MKKLILLIAVAFAAIQVNAAPTEKEVQGRVSMESRRVNNTFTDAQIAQLKEIFTVYLTKYEEIKDDQQAVIKLNNETTKTIVDLHTPEQKQLRKAYFDKIKAEREAKAAQ